MAGLTGLEPATSSVTGWHSNQLSYNPKGYCRENNGERVCFYPFYYGGRNRDRTCDIQLVRLALSQLSYSPDIYGGVDGARTRDFQRDRLAL